MLLLLVVTALLVVLVLLLEFVDVGVPDLPLRYLTTQVVSNGRTGGCPALLDRRVDRLHLPALVVELVPHGLLYSLNVLP
jgi:hypothetical protein